MQDLLADFDAAAQASTEAAAGEETNFVPASPAAEQAAQQQQRFRKRGKSPATPAEKEELVENAGLTPKTKKTTASPTLQSLLAML